MSWKDFRCKIGLHSWGQWSSPFLSREWFPISTNGFNTVPKLFVVEKQTRVCTHCLQTKHRMTKG